MTHRTHTTLLALACAAGLTACASVPDAIRVDANEHLVLTANAKGAWTYLCRVSTDGKSMSWDPLLAIADLSDAQGQPIGRMTAGPSFTHNDGSRVDAVRKAAIAPSPDAPPWMLFTAAESSGTGALSKVSSIQQVKTSGGRRPEADCATADHLMMEKRVPYAAELRFFSR
jgi:hypothetical protein